MLKIICFNKEKSGGMNNINSIKNVIKKFNIKNIQIFDRSQILKAFKFKSQDTYVIWMINHYALLLLIFLFFIRIFSNISIITIQHNILFHPQTSSRLHNLVSTLIEQIGFIISNKVCFLSKVIFDGTPRKNKILLSKVMPFDLYDNANSNQSKKDYDLLYFGRNINYKGLDILYDSLSKTKSSLKVAILGVNVSALPWDTLENKHSITVVDKYLSEENISKFINASEFCIYPYRSVSQCGPLVISLSFNQKAIVPDLEYFKYYASLKNIIFFKAGSSKSLTYTLDHLNDINKNINKLEINTGINDFSWVHLVNKLLSLESS